MRSKLSKAFILSLAMVFMLPSLSSCNGIQKALTFNIIAPNGGDGLSLASYASDTEHVKFASSDDCYDAFFTSDYDVIIFDLEKGIDLIQDSHCNYKLARVNTYGNAYLVGLNKESDSDISYFSNIVSYNYANSKYSDHTYHNLGIQNKIFKYIYGYSYSMNYIDDMYDDLEDEYNCLLTEKSNSKAIDYAILPEPYATKLVKEDSNYKIIYNITSKFKEMSVQNGLGTEGYSHYPQTGLFVSSSWDNDDKNQKDLHKNFFSSYDNMTISLERNNGSRVISYLDDYKSNSLLDVEDCFGADNDTLNDILDGSINTVNVNAMGFCSYAVDINDFQTQTAYTSSYLFTSLISATSFSSYYNKVSES